MSIATELISRNKNEMLKNELIVGAGLVALSGAIGFASGVSQNNQRRAKNQPTDTGQDFRSAFNGALVGIIIALIVFLGYRFFFHGQALSQKYNKFQQSQQLGELNHAKNISNVAKGIDVKTLKAVQGGRYSASALKK